MDTTAPRRTAGGVGRGSVMGRGGAVGDGLGWRLGREREMRIHGGESPLACGAVGAGRCLEEFEVMQKASSTNGRHRKRY